MTNVEMYQSPVSPESLIANDSYSFSDEAPNPVMNLEYSPSKAYQELPASSSASGTPDSLPLRPRMRARGEQASWESPVKGRQAQKLIYDYFGAVSKTKEVKKTKQPEEVCKKPEQPPPALFNEWKAPQYKEPHCAINQNAPSKAKTSGQRNRETYERTHGTTNKPASGFEHVRLPDVRCSVLPGFKSDLSTDSLTYLPASMSPRITDVVDHSLVPKPLRSNTPPNSENVCFELEDTHTERLIHRPLRADSFFGAPDLKEVTSAPRDIPPPIYQPINTPRKTNQTKPIPSIIVQNPRLQTTPTLSTVVQKPKPQPSRHAPLRSKLSLTTLPPTLESPLSFTTSSTSSSPTFQPRSPTFIPQITEATEATSFYRSRSTSSRSAEKQAKKWYSKRKQKNTTTQGDKARRKFRKDKIIILPPATTHSPHPAPSPAPVYPPHLPHAQDPTSTASPHGSPSEDDQITLIDLPNPDKPPKKPGKLVRLFESYSKHVEGLQMIQ